VIVNVCPAIDRVPVRAAFWLRATLNVTAPEPVFDAADVMVIQSALLALVHVQLGCEAVTVTLSVPPDASTVTDEGLSVNVHGGGAAADWSTVKVCPAIEAVPLRAAPMFGAIASVTVPLPLPLPPDATVIQAAPGVVLQLHDGADAVMATDAVPPEAATVWLTGVIVNEHGGAA